MSDIHPKKLVTLYILDILQKYTDEEHRLSQKEIQDILKKEYEMPVALTGGSDDEFMPMDDVQLEMNFDTPSQMDSAGNNTELQYTREILVLQTENGVFLRFPLKEIPEKKKSAAGVRGIKLEKEDKIAEVYLIPENADISIDYKGKEVSLKKLKTAKRDGKGTKLRA